MQPAGNKREFWVWVPDKEEREAVYELHFVTDHGDLVFFDVIDGRGTGVYWVKDVYAKGTWRRAMDMTRSS